MSTARSVTMDCEQCGTSQTVYGALFAGALLQIAERAHDEANPECPKRWSVPTGQEASE